MQQYKKPNYITIILACEKSSKQELPKNLQALVCGSASISCQVTKLTVNEWREETLQCARSYNFANAEIKTKIKQTPQYSEKLAI